MYPQKSYEVICNEGQQQLARLNQAVVLAKPESHQGHLDGLEELYRRAERNHPILRPLHLLYPQFSRKRLADSTFIEPVPKRMCLRVMAREVVPIEEVPLALAAPLPNQVIPAPVNAVDDSFNLSSDSSNDEDEEEVESADEETLVGESIELPVEEDEVPPAVAAAQIEIDDEVNFDLEANADIGMDDASNSSSSILVEEEDRDIEVDREEESTVRRYIFIAYDICTLVLVYSLSNI